jgi:hypothetical protein
MLYAIKRNDGGVSVMQTTSADINPADEIAKWSAELQAAHDLKSIKEINRAGIPSDRTFRDAWKHDLSVDMAKARDIQRDRIRAARAPQLAALSEQFMLAIEVGDAKTQAAVAKQKQVLRDATKHPDIEAAKTPEALKAVTLGILAATARAS